jgi:hypothetical protein
MIQRIGITLLLALLFFAPLPASAAGTHVLPCKHGASLITAALKRCADQSSPDKEILN